MLWSAVTARRVYAQLAHVVAGHVGPLQQMREDPEDLQGPHFCLERHIVPMLRRLGLGYRCAAVF